MTRIRYIYCSDNVLDWQNMEVLNATKECLDLKLTDQVSPIQSQGVEEPPLSRKRTKDLVPSHKNSPSKRAMDAES